MLLKFTLTYFCSTLENFDENFICCIKVALNKTAHLLIDFDLIDSFGCSSQDSVGHDCDRLYTCHLLINMWNIYDSTGLQQNAEYSICYI
jgi:hypothetical protein